MSHERHWYDIVTDERLRQGDIIRGLALAYFDSDIVAVAVDIEKATETADVQVPVKFVRGDWSVLDASCDVDHAGGRPPAVTQVLVGRIVAADREGLSARTEKELNERREALRQGLAHSKFLLPEFARIAPFFPLSYVEYRQRFAVSHAFLVDAVGRGGERLRLRHPLRERFGNWVGSAISRVGPEDEAGIPPFVPRPPSASSPASGRRIDPGSGVKPRHAPIGERQLRPPPSG